MSSAAATPQTAMSQMQSLIRWRKLLTSLTFWLLVEVSLNVVGLDDLADYSEFLFQWCRMFFRIYLSRFCDLESLSFLGHFKFL